MGQLLSNHIVMRDAHPGEISTKVNSLIGEHYLRLLGDRSPQRENKAIFCHRSINKIAFNYLYFGEEVMLSAVKPKIYYYLQFILDGQCSVQTSSGMFTATKGTALAGNPFRPEKFIYSEDCRNIVIRVEKEQLESFLADLLGIPIKKPLLFSDRIDTTRGEGADLYRLVDFFCQELNTRIPRC